MSTYKKTGINGVDYAVPSVPGWHPDPVPFPPPPPHKPVPPCPVPPPPPVEWDVYPYYPPYPYEWIEPVPMPPIPGKHPRPCPCPPPPPPYIPPYPCPRPEKVDECSKRLAKLTQKTKTLVQMIKDFEGKNRPVIITIGPNSYQFGTENITDFDGQAAKGMYASLISGDPIEELEEGTYTVDSTNTRVALKDPVDLLQSELARVRKEITLVTAAINEEIIPEPPVNVNPAVPGTDET